MVTSPTSVPPPSTPPGDLPELGPKNSCHEDSLGHTSWAHGGVDQTGMTTAWPPNKTITANRSPAGTVLNINLMTTVNLDLIGIRELTGGPDLRRRHEPQQSSRWGQRPVRRRQRALRQE